LHDETYSLAKVYVDLLRNHMHCEESSLYPMIEKHLNKQDWEEVNNLYAKVEDPLFGYTTEGFYLYLNQCITEYAESL